MRDPSPSRTEQTAMGVARRRQSVGWVTENKLKTQLGRIANSQLSFPTEPLPIGRNIDYYTQ